ncbi:MAG: hypothetical protein DRQ47_04335, partial [Gammaproteobacteria bacterium]
NLWELRKRRLEDWMLVYETEGLLLQRPLLVSMSQSEQGDVILKTRLLFLDASLNSRQEQLIDCSRFQRDKGIKLARRCIEAANKIKTSTQVQELLAEITEEQKDIRKQQLVKGEVASRNEIMDQAKIHLQKQFYYQAVQELQPLLEQKSEDEQVKLLMVEAITGRDMQLLQLVSHGDRLYREEKIKQALAIWQQAALLDPENEEVKQRIRRAKKVINKLQELRSKG